MKIAVDAADLCDTRVDGTRIYIKNVLDHLGGISKDDDFLIYLKGQVNQELNFKKFSNYKLRKSSASLFWTQLKFPFELKKDKPDVLWMPLQTVPFLVDKKLKVIVTIHDLAFNLFPDYFPAKDRFLLKLFTRKAIERADKIIAVSQNTKEDIVRQFRVEADKIKVIYHGYNQELFNPEKAQDKAGIDKIRKKFKLKGRYLLYVGALQARKNITVLVKAFESLKETGAYDDLKLVIAGPRAWLYEGIEKRAGASDFSKDIIFTGPFETENLPYLLGGAEAFVFPSLYEGFGIPVLEAMASATPVVCADNSSLPEVGGQAPEYFEAKSFTELSAKLKRVLDSDSLRREMSERGPKQAEKFSWGKCAKETLEVIKESETGYG